MNKRLRKKLHLAEFQALGFRVSGSLASSLDDPLSDRLFDDWITFIEARGLRCGGGIQLEPHWYEWYVERTPASCTEADRAAVGAWLRARPEVLDVTEHPFEDVYHPDRPPRSRGQR